MSVACDKKIFCESEKILLLTKTEAGSDNAVAKLFLTFRVNYCEEIKAC